MSSFSTSGWVCSSITKTFDEAINALEWKAISVSAPEGDDVLVEVLASSLNFFDLLIFNNKYQIQYSPPFTPCSEGVARILQLGPRCSGKYRVGDVVCLLFTINLSQHVTVVPESSIATLKPKHLSNLEASALLVGYTTAYHGLVQRGDLKRDEVLLVTGAAGGMGTLAIQLGKEIGAKVVAVVSSPEKAQLCKKVGADATLVLSQKSSEWAQQLKQALAPYGGNADVVYEVVGGDLFTACGRIMNAGGRLLVIGFAGGKIGSVQANLPLVKGYSVVGVRSGAEFRLRPELQEECMRAVHKSSIHPFIEVYPASQAKAAFRKLADRGAVGKLVLDFESEKEKTKSKL